MGGATGRHIPLTWVLLGTWVLLAGIGATGVALGVVSGSALKALLYVAILTCPLLHLLGGHQHGSGHEHHSGDRERPGHVHRPVGDDASVAPSTQAVDSARGKSRPA